VLVARCLPTRRTGGWRRCWCWGPTSRAAEKIADPREAFESVLRGYLEAAEGDAAFQLALMGSIDLEWEGLAQHKAEFGEVVSRIIDRAVASGQVRDDLTFADFPMLACGVISTMYFRPAGNSDWRRHLQIVLDGTRAEEPE
jgi:hypothetical protein